MRTQTAGTLWLINPSIPHPSTVSQSVPPFAYEVDAMKGNNLFREIEHGVAFKPQTISNGTYAGFSIVEPWVDAHQLVFVWATGTINAAAEAVVTVQGNRRDNPGTWEALKDFEGNDLTFLTGDLVEDKSVIGTLLLDTVDGAVYDAVRVFVDVINAGNAEVGASYILYDFRNHPAPANDALFFKQRKA